MEATAIIPCSALERRYDLAKEEFSDEYESSEYQLKERDYYLGGGGNNWRTQCEILALIESEIKKSYLEDIAPENWVEMRDHRNELLEYAAEKYKKARDMVRDGKFRYQVIQAEVEDKLEEMFGDCKLHHHDVIEMELDIINEFVNVKVEYYINDHTEHCSGTYDTPPYTWGHVEIEYVITVINEDGEEEQEIEDTFKF